MIILVMREVLVEKLSGTLVATELCSEVTVNVEFDASVSVDVGE